MDVRSGQVLVINGVSADFGNQTLRDKSGRSLALRPQAFAVLRHLAENANRLVTKDELIRAVWRGVAVTDDSLVQCIHEIRRALDDKGQTVLKTLPKRGYWLELSAPAVSDAPAPGGSREVLRLAAAVGGALVLVLASLGWSLFGRDDRAYPSIDRPPVVTVIPFVNVAGDQTSQSLAIGLRKTLFAELSRPQEFQVAIGDAPDPYGQRPADTRFVLGGSIDHEADRLRITEQLVDASTGAVLWSKRWDRPDQGMLALQTEISAETANHLGGSGGLFHREGREIARAKPPADLTAYELYLLGTEKLEQVNLAGVQEAIRLLDRSVERDPRLARAWVELYRAHEMAADFGVDADSHRTVAAYAAERAVQLNPGDAKAHLVFGMSLVPHDLARSKFEFDTALILAPDVRDVLALYGGRAFRLGASERGAETADQLVRRYPDLPRWSAVEFAHAYFMAGRYGDALAMANRLAPENHALLTWAVHAAALAAVGRTEEAHEWVVQALAARPDLTIEAMANTPGLGDIERQRLVDTMRIAGFPPCAKPGTMGMAGKPFSLPECQTKS